MLLPEAFPTRGTSPEEPKPYFDRESDTVTPTVSKARSFPTVQNAKRGAKQVRGKGENRTSWAGVNDEQESEPQGWEAEAIGEEGRWLNVNS